MGSGYEIGIIKPAEKRPLRRLRHRWEDNIKIYLRVIRALVFGFDSSGSEDGPVTGSFEYGNEVSSSIKGE
jgi:hypothetical protein